MVSFSSILHIDSCIIVIVHGGRSTHSLMTVIIDTVCVKCPIKYSGAGIIRLGY